MASVAQPLKLLARLSLVALAYGITARISLNLALVHGQVTPIWPPTGIAVVAFLLFGRWVWPAIYLAAFVVNLPIGPSPLGAACIAVGNTVAPLVAAELLRRIGFHRQLDRLLDAMAIIFLGALGGMLISATVGSTVLLAGGAIDQSHFWSTWAVWWTGDAMGVLLVAPFLLSLIALWSPPLLTWRAALELAGLLAVTGIVTYLLFLNDLRLEYLVLPLIMLSAWRFHLRGAAPAALIASVVAVVCAVNGLGPFAEETLFEKMATLQVFNVSLALASFVLASFVETREREERVARLYAVAESANQAKTRFLHMAAHELRTPISVIRGYLSMLSDGELGALPPAWKRPLEMLAEKSSELNRLVDDLLEASRVEANNTPRIVSQVDLRELTEEAIERARPRATLLGADLAMSLPAEPVLIRADPIQLGRILDNLINNGLTYNTGIPHLQLSVKTVDSSAEVRVTDNGIGVPEHDRERIFEQFHRSSYPAINVPGTGLGLYISRELATANGGRLALESSSSAGGSVFLLTFPRVPSVVSTPFGELAKQDVAERSGEAVLTAESS